jgi:hypothetical protein
MDPVAWGGDLDEYEGLYDDLRDPFIAAKNTVYCCRECNARKGDMLFCDWLKTLKPRNRSLARQIYTRKHGYEPEQFEPQRVNDGCLTWRITAEDG